MLEIGDYALSVPVDVGRNFTDHVPKSAFLRPSFWDDIPLHPHQEEAIDKCRNGSILIGGVGTGKSRASLAYYAKAEAPRPVYVITTAKKRDSLDWEGEAAHFGIGKTAESTVAGQLVVDSWNNVGKYVDVEGAFFIFDEQRAISMGAWGKAVVKIAKRNRWILLSATPGDTWLDYAPVFVANGFYKNITEFKREHCVFSHYGAFPKLERYLGEDKLKRLRDSILVDMPYERHTTRHMHQVTVEHDAELMKLTMRRRWNPFTNRPIKDAGELYRTMREISNSAPSRFQSVIDILKTHPKLIVFYNFDYELHTLRTLSDMGYSVAEWNGHKHEEIPQTDSWVYLVQYRSGAEGWNCIKTNAIAFYSLTYSYRDWAQSQGRIDRLNTPFTDLHYYVLRSRSFIDLAIWRALSEKRNFNEKALMMKEVSLAA